MTKPPAAAHDAHRHIGRLPAFGFYGGPPVSPDTTARATVAELIADLDLERTERALVLPNYGVPDPDVAFGLNHLALDAAHADDRVRCGLWTSPKASDSARNDASLALAGEERGQEHDDDRADGERQLGGEVADGHRHALSRRPRRRCGRSPG